MKKINTLNIKIDDLSQYEHECFIEIKKDPIIYGLLLDNGFSDELIKKNIGSCHTFYEDYYRWEKIKTYEDVVNTGEKFNYKLIYDGKTIIHERGILQPYQTYMDYVSKFIIKDFGDEFNKVSLSKVNNRELKNEIRIQLESKSWIYLTGAIRSGRTYCAIALANGSANNGNNDIAFLDAQKEIKYLNDLYFNDSKEFLKMMQKLKESHLLIFDGMGNEYVNDIIRDTIIIPLLQERAANRLMTIFTSDFSLEDLITLYSKKDKSGNNIKVKQMANILHSMIRKEIVTSKVALY